MDIPARLVIVDLHVENVSLGETVAAGAGSTNAVGATICVLLASRDSLETVLVGWVVGIDVQVIDANEEVDKDVGLVIKDEVFKLVAIVEVDGKLGLFGAASSFHDGLEPEL